MALIERTIENTSGIPLGGIGAGSVEIREDGLFHEWQIFNAGRWSPQSPQGQCCGGKPAIPTMRPEDFTFIVRTEGGGRRPSAHDGVKVRRLAIREQLNNLYSFAWLKCVQTIRFRGEFPVARLEYVDDTLPVEVSAEVFGTFIPHDERASGTPGFYVRFSVKNVSAEPVKVSILATLANPIPCGGRVHRVSRDAGLTMLTLSADEVDAGQPHQGSITLGVAGGEHSFIAGTYEDERKGIFIWNKTYGLAARSCLFDFRQTGLLPNLDAGRMPEMLPDGFDAANVTAAERKRLLASLLKHSVFYYKHKRIADCDPALLEGEKNQIAFLNDVAAEMKNHFAKRADAWRDALLCSACQVAPSDEAAVTFALGWFFPNHISPKSGNIGHMYANWFKDSAGVCRHLMNTADLAREKTVGFARTLFDTTMDYHVADSISAQLSTIVKCTWWTKQATGDRPQATGVAKRREAGPAACSLQPEACSGDFGVWEGLGCCGFHTTDITYDGSFSLIALFPTLQKQQMIMGARHQRDDGRIPHFFTPDFSQTDGDYARVDMNPQFVLLVARDYLWTSDRTYLAALWEHVVKAIENTKLLDADGDGLPDHDCERQTYDAWEFYGCPSYIASLWLASLKAGIRLADEMGDAKKSARWKRWHAMGVKNFDKLWNGEYYVLWKEMNQKATGNWLQATGPADERKAADPAACGLQPDACSGRVDECCMTDQIDGDWFTALMGWGNVLPVERIKAALRAIFRYNYSTEDGLKNATYPPGKQPRISTYLNLQEEAPWTGIEYAIASMFIDYGMIREGIEIVRNVYDRYQRAGRVWNHVECGDHYYRAMSSWAILLAMSGFRVDAPSGTLTISPAVKQPACRLPFAASTGWGAYSHESGVGEFAATLECRSGKLEFSTLRLGAAPAGGTLSPTLYGKKIACEGVEVGGVVEVRFKKTVKMGEGDAMRVRVGKE